MTDAHSFPQLLNSRIRARSATTRQREFETARDLAARVDGPICACAGRLAAAAAIGVAPAAPGIARECGDSRAPGATLARTMSQSGSDVRRGVASGSTG